MRILVNLLGLVTVSVCSDPRAEVRIMLEAAKEIESKSKQELEFWDDPSAQTFLVPRDFVASGGGPKWFEGTKDESILGKLRISLSTASEKKCMYLFEFLVHRPDWFAATRRDIWNLRKCFDQVVGSRHASLADPKFEKFATEIIPLLYSGAAELLARGALDRDLTVESELRNHFFDSYQLDKIGTKLVEGLSDSPDDFMAAISDESVPLSFMNRADRRYFEHVMDAEDRDELVLNSLPQFLHAMLTRLAEAGQFEAMLYIQNILTDKFPTTDFDREIFFNSAYYGSSPNTFWLKSNKLYDTTPAWLSHVLRYLDQIYQKNVSAESREEFERCVVYDVSRKAVDQISDIVAITRESPSALITMFDCILKEVWLHKNLKLPVPVRSGKPLYARTYGIIIQMTRIAASPMSFLVGSKSPATRIRANLFSLRTFSSMDKSFTVGSFGRSNDFPDIPDLPAEYESLAEIVGREEDCLYWFIFAEYIVDKETAIPLVDRFVEKLTTGKGIEYLGKNPGMASYIEQRIRQVYSKNNLLVPLPSGKNPADFIFTQDALNIVVEPGHNSETGGGHELPPMLEFFFGGLRPLLFSSPKIRVTEKIGKLILDSLRPSVTMSEVHELCQFLSMEQHFEDLIFASSLSPHRSYPFFIEMFDLIIDQLVSSPWGDRHLQKALTLFKVMGNFGRFDELDVKRFQMGRFTPTFHEWSGSFMAGDNYNVIGSLVVDSWHHNKQVNPSGVIALDKCFSKSLFTDGKKISTDGPAFPTVDNYQAFTKNLKKQSGSAVISMHRCFLYGLLDESITLPPPHGDLPKFRVTQLLLLLRMVTGAPAFLNA